MWIFWQDWAIQLAIQLDCGLGVRVWGFEHGGVYYVRIQISSKECNAAPTSFEAGSPKLLHLPYHCAIY